MVQAHKSWVAHVLSQIGNQPGKVSTPMDAVKISTRWGGGGQVLFTNWPQVRPHIPAAPARHKRRAAFPVRRLGPKPASESLTPTTVRVQGPVLGGIIDLRKATASAASAVKTLREGRTLPCPAVTGRPTTGAGTPLLPRAALGSTHCFVTPNPG